MSTTFSPSKNWRERGYRKPGRKLDVAKALIKNRFKLTEKQSQGLPLEQLTRIDYAPAVRVLLGRTVKAKRGETWPVPDLHLASWRRYLEKVA